MILNFKKWTALHEASEILLFESAQEGKQIIQSIIDQELKKLNPEENPVQKLKAIEAKLQNKYLGPTSDFEEIKRMLHKNEWQKYIGPFTRFRYIQEAELSVLKNLFAQLIKLRDHITELPMSIDAYSKIGGDPNAKKGWDKLGDDLNSIEELIKGDWLVKLLPKAALSNQRARDRGLSPVNLKEKYRASSQSTKNRLRELASKISQYPTLKSMISGKLSGTSSIEDLIEDLERTIRTLGSQDRQQLLNKAADAGNSVRLVYNGENHVVFSFRNDRYLPHLCKNAVKWCIQPCWYNTGYCDQFFSYADGSLQIGIIDFTVDQLNQYHTVGVTIYPDKKIKALCNQPDHCITRGENYANVLKKFNCGDGEHGYPDELIDAIEEIFDEEMSIKTITDPIYRAMKNASTGTKSESEALIKSLTGLMRDMQSIINGIAKIDDPEFEKKVAVARKIVFKELTGAEGSDKFNKVKEEILNQYTSGKSILSSEFDLDTFTLMFKNSNLLTKEKIDKIIKVTDIAVQKVTRISNNMGKDNPLFEKLKRFLDGATLVLAKLKQNT